MNIPKFMLKFIDIFLQQRCKKWKFILYSATVEDT